MAELSLDKIVEKLNEEFKGGERRLIFWYDDKGDFREDIKSVKLENAEVYELEPANQFKTKIFLERGEGKDKSFLIYAPFSKPPVEENHLEDTLLYSKRFYADRASLICADLKLSESLKPVLEKYSKFLAEKKRLQRLYAMQLENVTEEILETALICAVCSVSEVVSFEEALRKVLCEDIKDNRLMSELTKYDLADAFWRECSVHFGYTDKNPSIAKLLFALFVTYTAKSIKGESPRAWEPYITQRAASVMAFLDGMKNNIVYTKRYDELSEYVEKELAVKETFSLLSPESYVECDTFICVDEKIAKWLSDTLLNEDTGAKLSGHSIPEICQLRRKKHFSGNTSTTYDLMESAWHIISVSSFKPAKRLNEIADRYVNSDYETDGWYRKFIFSLDHCNSSDFGRLSQLVENIYTNEYLGKLLPAWNEAFTRDPSSSGLELERKFYDRQVKNLKERVVVIISDAMRYEVGKQLEKRLEQESNSTVTMSAQLSVLPSFTPLGMAALLPHDKLGLTEDCEEGLVDGKSTVGLSARQEILQLAEPDSVCVKFDNIKNMNSRGLRDIMTSKQVIYVYHNQIDARGESSHSEDEVFNACEEAVEEIASLICKISNNANTHRFIVTADHGFIYKRNALSESDKISATGGSGRFTERRFVIDDEPIDEPGIAHVSLGDMLGNDDSRIVSFPESTSVFKAGGGMNYVHGGSSPQEMIIPVLNVKMGRERVEAQSVGISLLSTVRKITNLITSLDFIQLDPVSDTFSPCSFRILFESEDGNRISNENVLVADSASEESSKRITRFTFSFKNQRYDPRQKYYLVAYKMDNGVKAYSLEMTIDIAFSDDFGF